MPVWALEPGPTVFGGRRSIHVVLANAGRSAAKVTLSINSPAFVPTTVRAPTGGVNVYSADRVGRADLLFPSSLACRYGLAVPALSITARTLPEGRHCHFNRTLCREALPEHATWRSPSSCDLQRDLDGLLVTRG